MYRHPATFVNLDHEILASRYAVYPLHVTLNLLGVLAKFIVYTWQCRIVFVWFAGIQGFLSVLFAKIFRRKIVAVAGGYDAAYEPEIKYGAFTCWWRRLMARFVFEKVDLILAVSKYTAQEVLRRSKLERLEMVYNGIDTNIFNPGGVKEDFVLTVGAINMNTLKKKGLETFVKAARHLPETKFVLVGGYESAAFNLLKSVATKNVRFTGRVPFAELLDYYRRAKVYAQLSFHESFGMSLAEAMACECVPVITGRAALSEVVGECGYYVPYGDAEATANTIKKALGADRKLAKKARRRVVRYFSIERRKIEILKCIDDLIKD